MSNWNVLSVEAALQQLNCQEGGTVAVAPRWNTVITLLRFNKQFEAF